jgi:hypothetical protein
VTGIKYGRKGRRYRWESNRKKERKEMADGDTKKIIFPKR